MPRSVRVADTVTCSSTDAARFSSTTTVFCWPAARSTDADAAANPSLTTTMSRWPGGIVNPELPCAWVLCGVPFTTTSASRTGPAADRTSIWIRAAISWDGASPTFSRQNSATISRCLELQGIDEHDEQAPLVRVVQDSIRVGVKCED